MGYDAYLAGRAKNKRVPERVHSYPACCLISILFDRHINDE